MAEYKLTLADLRRKCPLLAAVEVIGANTKEEQLIGRNHRGEIVVRSPKGKITPKKSEQFFNDYQTGVAIGAIKAKPQEEPNV